MENEPEREMQRVAHLLGLEYEPQMLEGYRFNPIYPGETGIDNSRARADAPDPMWSESFPDAMRAYETLLGLAARS